MKKVLLWVLSVVVVLLVGIVVVVMFHLGGIIKTGVETMGPKYTGSSVTLESAYLRPLSGKAKLKELVVGNPEGFKTPQAIRLGELSVKLDIASLKTDTIIVESILIDGPEITMEGIIGRNNLKAIMENVEAQAPAKEEGEPDPKPEPKPEPAAEEETAGKKVVIKDLVVSNGKIGVSGALIAGKQLSIPLPKIHLTGIGEKTAGVTAAEAIGLLMDAIMKSAFSAVGSSTDLVGKGLKALGDGALGAVGNVGVSNVADLAADAAGALNEGIKSGGEALGGALGKTDDVAHDAGKKLSGALGEGPGAVGDAGKKLSEGLGNLTGGLGSGSKKDEAKAEDTE